MSTMKPILRGLIACLALLIMTALITIYFGSIIGIQNADTSHKVTIFNNQIQEIRTVAYVNGMINDVVLSDPKFPTGTKSAYFATGIPDILQGKKIIVKQYGVVVLSVEQVSAKSSSCFEIKDHYPCCQSLAIDEKNRRLISSGYDGFFSLYDTTSNTLMSRWHGHNMPVWAMKFIDEDHFISASSDHKVILWDITKQSPESVWIGGDRTIFALAFNKNDRVCYAADSIGNIYAMESNESAIKRIDRIHGVPNSIVTTRDNRIVCASSQGVYAAITKNDKFIKISDAPPIESCCGVVSDGKGSQADIILIAFSNGDLYKYNTVEMRALKMCNIGYKINSIRMAVNNTTIIVAGRDEDSQEQRLVVIDYAMTTK